MSLFEKIEVMRKAHRFLIFVGTLLLLGACFFYFIYMPKAGAINRTEDEISGLGQRLKAAKLKAKNLAKFSEEMAQVNRRFQKALKLLPDRREIPSLLKEITQLGVDSHLEFRLFRPDKELPHEFFVEIPVSIEIKGTYQNVAIFFDEIRRMDRIVNIINISMKPEKPLSASLITKCKATTYRFSPEEADVQKPARENKEAP